MLAVLAALGAALGARPSHATVTTDLCSGSPCAVSGAHVIDPGSVLDFGTTTDLHLLATASLKVGPSQAPARFVTLRARSIVLDPGAKILGNGDNAVVALEATGGAISLLASGSTAAKIDLHGSSAGNVSLTASDAVSIGGVITVAGVGPDSDAGSIDVTAGTLLTTTNDLLAGATGADSIGGEIQLQAGTGVAINGGLDVSSPSDAGSIAINSDLGPISLTKRIDASGGDPDGFGGSIDIQAGYGSVSISGPIFAIGGTGADSDCGDGGDLSITTGLDATISAPITLDGGTDCNGGSIDVTAATGFTQAAGADVSMQAAGSFGSGGDFSVDSSGDVVVRNVDLTSPGFGGSVKLSSEGGSVAVRGVVDARGIGPDSLPGTIDAGACKLNVAAAARLDARGDLAAPDNGTVTLTASNQLIVSGTLLAATGNELRVRSGQPTVSGSATPAATIVVDPSIPACAPAPVCGNGVVEAGELCDDGAANGLGSSCCGADCKSAKADGASCDDGLFCNGADTCQATRCVKHAGLPCGGATGECVNTPCDEVFHCFKPAQTPCNDGDANPCTDGQCNGQGACVAVPNHAPCEDGTFCNGSESCVGGSCHRTPRACSADSCDEGGSTCEAFCGDGTAQDGEQCGEPGLSACAPGQTCRGCVCEAGGIPGDSYLCNTAALAPAPPSQFVPGTKPVEDRFESRSYDATGISGLCSPAVVTSPQGTFPPSFRSTPEVDHAIALSATVPPQEPFQPSVHTYTDRFGSLQLKLVKPQSLMLRAKQTDFGPVVSCVSSSTCASGDTCQSGVCLPDPAAAPDKAPKPTSPVANYECYQAKVKPGTPAFVTVPGVRVTNALGATVLVDLVKPTRVCSPANVAAQNPGAKTEPVQLSCYKAKLSASTPPEAQTQPHEVGVRTKGFGPAFLTVSNATELCVPSLVDATP
jgi:hypothetical protein